MIKASYATWTSEVSSRGEMLNVGVVPGLKTKSAGKHWLTMN